MILELRKHGRVPESIDKGSFRVKSIKFQKLPRLKFLILLILFSEKRQKCLVMKDKILNHRWQITE